MVQSGKRAMSAAVGTKGLKGKKKDTDYFHNISSIQFCQGIRFVQFGIFFSDFVFTMHPIHTESDFSCLSYPFFHLKETQN